jgi:hypothetical protein
MSDPNLRNFAQQENNHILFLLLRPSDAATAEDVVELAERNCRATTECFGETDSLHAMALNTLAFVYMQKDIHLDVARDSAATAMGILQGQDNEKEMLLEARCLSAITRIKTGTSASVAIQETFRPDIVNPTPAGRQRAASEALSEVLVASVFNEKVESVVLLIALREVTAPLLEELKAEGAAHQTLENNLQTFLQTYYRSPGKDS